ncbi:MAG: hypothetical protein GC154_06420 [bacterium]|nr:hypothetical protein [bacterium]
MERKTLPPTPSLNHLKQQASGLHEEIHRKTPSALDRLARYHPRYAQGGPVDAGAVKLADALLVVAREYGFSSWPTLKAHVEELNLSQEETVNALIKDLCANRFEKAAARLAAFPDLKHASIHSAATACDPDALSRWIERRPQAFDQRGGPLNATPLWYVCHSRIHTTGAPYAEGKMRCAILLLERGADPSASVSWPRPPHPPLSALYGACGQACHPPLARLLIERGAEIDDNESLYHSTEHRDHECTRMLLERGARIDGTNAVFHMLDHEDLEGLNLMLAYGPDPRERLAGFGTLLHFAVIRGRGTAILDRLIGYGVEIDAKNEEGFTAYQLAMRRGYTYAAERLAQHGADTQISARDRFLASCSRGDEAAIHAQLAASPSLIESLTPNEMHVIANAAQQGRLNTLRTLLDAGFDVNSRGEHGGTPLHWAAWFGRIDALRLLLNRGASMEIRCKTFGCTPFMWAAHGAEHCRNPEGDYVAVIRALAEAGSSLALRNKWNELLLPETNREAMDCLLALGAESPDD